MENRARLVVIALVAVLAVGVGFGAGAFLTGNREAPTAAPTGVAEATGEPTDSASASPTEEPTEPESESATPTDEAPSADASATAGPAQTATITFQALLLDAADDPDGTDRIFTWASATGSVKAEVTSATGDLEMCLSTPDKELGCRTAGSGTLSAKTTKSRETFILTLRGRGTEQPAVDVTLTFPARKPKVSIDNARFDGTAYPDTNGIQAVFTPRHNGEVGVIAEWGGHPLMYEIDLIEQGGSGSLSHAPDQGNIGTDVDFAVTAPNPWKLVLQNTETGFGVTPMNASISWP